MSRPVGRRVTATLLLAAWATQSLAAVEREDIIILRADGLHYTSYKTLRSDLAERILYLGPDEAPENAVFIVPDDYESTPLDDDGTRLHFKSGSFALMNTGAFDGEVERRANNVHVFNSWDGVTRADGHLGKWNAPNDFASFSYTWVMPRNIDILAYKANREGRWEKQANTLNWTGKQVNDIAFTIRYRVNNPDTDGAAQPAPARPPQRAAPPFAPPRPQRPFNDLETAPSTSFADRPQPATPPAQPQSSAQPEPATTPDASSTSGETRSVRLDNVVTLTNERPQITTQGKTVLRRLAGTLATDATQRVVIHGPGFTQSRDTGGSVAQAARTSDFLVAHGVTESRIEIRAGERSDSADSRAIEITVAPGTLLDGFSQAR